MKPLIKSEFFKLFKSKMHIILIVLLTLSTIVFTYYSFKDYGKLYDDLKYYENFSGEKISSISAARIVDETLHQYAGEWSDKTYQQIKDSYLKLILKYPRLVIDDEAMKKAYGENYQDIMEKSLAGELTDDMIREYMSAVNNGRSFGWYGDEEGHSYIPLYYQEDGVNNLLSLIFTSPYLVGENDPRQSFDMTWNEYDTILNDGEKFIKDVYFQEPLTTQQKILQDYFVSKVKDLPQTFDSVVPNNLFFNALRTILWAPLFVVIILLANMFGIERQHRMEEIIYPTASSKYKITIAKLITGTCVGVGVVWLQILVCLIVSFLLLPIHTWNIVIMNMSSSSVLDVGGFYIPYTYLTLMMFCILLTTVGSFVISVITLSISYAYKSRFVVVIIMSILMVISWFSKRLMTVPDFLKAFMPYNMLSFLDYFYGYMGEDRYPYFVFGQFVIPYSVVVMIIWVLICIFIIVLIVKHSRQPVIKE